MARSGDVVAFIRGEVGVDRGVNGGRAVARARAGIRFLPNVIEESLGAARVRFRARIGCDAINVGDGSINLSGSRKIYIRHGLLITAKASDREVAARDDEAGIEASVDRVSREIGAVSRIAGG